MAGIIIRSTGVEIYYITTRRSNHMKLMDKAKQAALAAAVKTGLSYLEKDPEVNIPKLMELVDKVVPDGWYEAQRNAIRNAIQDKNSNWYKLILRIYDLDPGVREAFFTNFIINASLKGSALQEETAEANNCNVPWAILLDPTSACNLHCTGCWAAEYGHKLNLDFDTICSIVEQGRKLGTYMYIYTGGEPLVRKKDLIRICEKYPDCEFLSFTNGTLIDEEFCQEMLRVKNFVPAISLEGSEEANDGRRGDGVYQKVMHAMELLKSHKLPFGVSTCYTSANVDSVSSEEYFDHMIDCGALFVWFFHYMPTGNDAVVELMPNPQQREKMYHKIREYRSTKAIFSMDNKPLNGGFAAVVKYINASKAQVVAIDVPSGLMCEDNTYNIRQNMIRADVTLSIQLPKLSFLFPENEDIVGEWQLLDIQLKKDFIDTAQSPYYITEEEEIRSLIKPRKRFAHKGTFGHALLIAGSYGMAGASILSARACLRSGVGLLTVHVPIHNHDLLQTTVPEAIVQTDIHDHYFAEPVDTDRYQAIAIGPGLGQEEDTALAMMEQIQGCPVPLVLDADAINIFGTHRNWLSRMPKRCILTPHLKELERLIGKCMDTYERLTKTKELAAYLQSYIIIKGSWSTVVTPEGNCYFNPTGNPGMATAGSGDVLTGILAALLAQGYTQEDACRLGVYVHGLAGDIAAEEKGEIGTTSSDLIDALPAAWKKLTETKGRFTKE